MEKTKFDFSSWQRIKKNGQVSKVKRNIVKSIIAPKRSQNTIKNFQINVEITSHSYNNGESSNQNMPEMGCSGKLIPQSENSDENMDDSNENWNIELDENEDESFGAEIMEVRSSSLIHDLSEWSSEHRIKRTAIDDLLAKLNKNLPALNLPKDSRTVLGTPREKVAIVEDGSGGSYWHYGLEKALVCILGRIEYCKEVKLNINVDGLPLHRSSKVEFWPILANIYGKSEVSPFVIGIYCGKGKPESINWFLSPFVKEFLEIRKNCGIIVNGKKVEVHIRCFICDTPARTSLKGTFYSKVVRRRSKLFVFKGVIGHNGYHSCLKCVTKGSYSHTAKHMIFTELTAARRTDVQFRSGEYPEHCKNTTVVSELNIDMVEDFPVAECLHLIDLGVTKRLLTGWKTGNLNNHRARWSVRQSAEVSEFLEKCKLPSEIHRKMRGLDELAHWKGTEYRSFLLYVSIVVVKKFFESSKVFDHFLLYFCAVVICTRNDQREHHLNVAESMFQDFLINFKVLYGIDHFTSNLHNLCHVVQDVRKFGPLDTFSAYPFESKLFVIKSLLRNGTRPLSQVAKRICEQETTRKFNKIASKKTDSFVLKKQIKDISVTDASNLTSLRLQNYTIYSEVEFSDFKLKSNQDNDSWILSNSFEIICVKFIIKTPENTLYLYGSAVQNTSDYFEYPVSSSELNIYQSNCVKKPPACYSLSDVYCKMVRIKYDDEISIFIPLFHTIKSRN